MVIASALKFLRLTNCKSCRMKISRSTRICPHCNAKDPGGLGNAVVKVAFVGFVFYIFLLIFSPDNKDKSVSTQQVSSRMKLVHDDSKEQMNQDDTSKNLIKKAENGDAKAQLTLGARYSVGRDFPQSDIEAVKWIKKAAEQGNPTAQLILGSFFEEGKGVSIDENEAVKWYKLAADQGDSDAQLKLAMMYKYGKGVPRDESEALKILLKLAEEGNVIAQYTVGNFYAMGDEGISKDYIKAYAWLTLSETTEGDSVLKRISKEMSSAQISSANDLIRDWQSNHRIKVKGVSNNDRLGTKEVDDGGIPKKKIDDQYVSGAIYKGKDEQGKIIYSDQPVANGEKTEFTATSKAVTKTTLSIENAQKQDFQKIDKVIKAIPSSPNWDSIEIEEAGNHQYSLTIWYKNLPSGYSEVESDTKFVARTILKELMSSGVNPSNEMIFIFVYGSMHVLGETGTNKIRAFGNAFYSPANDELKFEKD